MDEVGLVVGVYLLYSCFNIQDRRATIYEHSFCTERAGPSNSWPQRDYYHQTMLLPSDHSAHTTDNPCIGLFGTCGNSRWRDRFMAAYNEAGITFYNPQVEGEWDPSMATIEANHLANDPIILFPVTGETYGTGSLAETGFSILQALKFNQHRYTVVMIDPVLDAKLTNQALRQESLRARALVTAHLYKLAPNLPGLYVVESLDDMLALSLELHTVATHQAGINRRFKPLGQA